MSELSETDLEVMRAELLELIRLYGFNTVRDDVGFVHNRWLRREGYKPLTDFHEVRRHLYPVFRKGIYTVEELADHIAEHGPHWFTNFPGIGPKGARIIQDLVMGDGA